MNLSLFFILILTMPFWMAFGVIAYFLRKEQGSIFYPVYRYSTKNLEPITSLEDGLILSSYENL
ncbi:MAG: hypothetical protein COB02_09245 [Candidatus Cloacimonadota bacterium]|nr:MAG: hypothetical protein COB02_09245 [Candidatus Cloacimonadota bacterium]